MHFVSRSCVTVLLLGWCIYHGGSKVSTLLSGGASTMEVGILFESVAWMRCYHLVATNNIFCQSEDLFLDAVPAFFFLETLNRIGMRLLLFRRVLSALLKSSTSES